MKKTTYYLSMLCIAFSIASVQQVSLVAGTKPTVQAAVNHNDRLDVLAQKGVPMIRSIDYGMSTEARIVLFFVSLISTAAIAYSGYEVTEIPLGQAQYRLTGGLLLLWCIGAYLVAFCTFYGGLLTLMNISSIKFLPNELQLPAHCLERGFFGRIGYSLLPAALPSLDRIDYNQIAYVDLIVLQETLTTQDETTGKKEIIWGIEVQHTHTTGSQRNVYHCTLVIVLVDGRVYKVKAGLCQGYNSFETILSLFKQKDIPIIQKRNY